MAAPKRKRVNSDLRMILCASQGWTCNACREILPAAVEIDHFIPLGCGFWNLIDMDPNSHDNLQALCPNCHAAKTMKERLYQPRGSAVPCACGKTHSRYFLPRCRVWRKALKTLHQGVRRGPHRTKRLNTSFRAMSRY